MTLMEYIDNEFKQYKLNVLDTELNDFIEDVLLEKFGFEPDYVIVNESMSVRQTIHFYNQTTDRIKLLDALNSFDTVELQEIFKLNN